MMRVITKDEATMSNFRIDLASFSRVPVTIKQACTSDLKLTFYLAIVDLFHSNDTCS